MALDEQVRRALETFAARVSDEMARQAQAVATELVAAAEADRDRALLGARQASEREAAGRLSEAVAALRLDGQASELAASRRRVEAIRAIGEARSLTEVLDTLAGCAGREAPRAAVFLVRGQQLRGWRLAGFGFEGPADDISIPCEAAGVITDALREGAVAFTHDLEADRGVPLGTLPAGRDGFAMPLMMGGQTVAVLYADRGAAAPAIDPQQETAGGGQPAGPESADLSLDPAIGWRDSLEILARHAARCLEVLTSTKTRRAPGDVRHPPAERAGTNDAEADQAARRYARLLVSEIKLYHEAQVGAGQRERDLATRLGTEIARARAMYNARVAPELRRRTDYFHEELVRTLANGDATLIESPAHPSA